MIPGDLAEDDQLPVPLMGWLNSHIFDWGINVCMNELIYWRDLVASFFFFCSFPLYTKLRVKLMHKDKAAFGDGAQILWHTELWQGMREMETFVLFHLLFFPLMLEMEHQRRALTNTSNKLLPQHLD